VIAMDHIIRFTDLQWASLQSGLWARADVETGAIVFGEPTPSPRSASVAVRNIVFVPFEAYRVRKSDFIEIDPIWMNRQCFEARRGGLSVFTAHTHLSDGPAWFSWADDQGDRRLMPALLAQMPDRPHGALNITRTDALARTYASGLFHAARISVAGRGLAAFPNVEATAASPTHARQALALGRQGHARLSAIRVGVIGVGGAGSIVCTLLGRLGVRWYLLFDADRLEASNFSRVLESSHADIDAKAFKVAVAARALRALVPGCNVTAIERHLVDQLDLDLLSACDVVFSCVDGLTPRAVLNRFAYDVKVPVIDMGSAFRVDTTERIVSQGGKVVVIGPGRPCLWCWGDLDAERIRVESLSPSEREQEARHGYIEGADEPQPSVVTFNATLAAAAVTELLRMVTGFAGRDERFDRINFDFARGTATRARGRSRPGCRFCSSE
jgi:molybdopterin-synthase adenylyltransferase